MNNTVTEKNNNNNNKKKSNTFLHYSLCAHKHSWNKKDTFFLYNQSLALNQVYKFRYHTFMIFTKKNNFVTRFLEDISITKILYVTISYTCPSFLNWFLEQ